MERVDFIEETLVFLPLDKDGIKSLREDHARPPPGPLPQERENRRTPQCSRMSPVIERAQPQARATFGRSGFTRMSGAKRVRNPSGIARPRAQQRPLVLPPTPSSNHDKRFHPCFAGLYRSPG